MATTRIISLPAGTPREIVDTLSGAIQRAMATDEHKKKMEEGGFSLRYMNPAQTEAYWADMETQVQSLMALAQVK